MTNRIIQFLFIALLLCVLSCKDAKISTEPDGSSDEDRVYKIAFVSDCDREFRYQFYIMDSDGTDQTRLTHDLNSYFHPRFSPDGSKIVLYSDAYDTDSEIIWE